MTPPVGFDVAGLRRTTLDNGLTVLSEEIPGVRSVAFGAFVQAGSIHEPRERMGVSHLLEHMVFKGTPTRTARQLSLEVETLGGSLDAYTTREYTSYQARVLDEHLDVATDVIADLVFRPLLRDADLALERNVVIEEIGMVEDTPDDLVFELHNELLWGSHPYGHAILGTRETVGALGTAELRALHERAYHPGRVVVAAAGRVEHDRLVESLVRSGWDREPRRDATPLATCPPTPQAPAYRHEPDRELTQTHVVFGSTTVPHADPRRYALSLVSMLLGGGMSSRLFQKVREEQGLAYAVHTFQSFHVDTGLHGVYVASAPETARRAADSVREELARLASESLPDEELEAGKRQLKGQITLSLESVTNRMYRAAGVELFGEPFRTLDDALALVERINPEDVRDVCAAFFAPEQQTVLSLGPKAVG
ncbi:M16 family metallopeptidase [Gemmatirosa kalamazoonensis]|uniref:M16 family metallopeptidase n=1 Tax=Gemmatirosa kalamazoonensis TaxID=861299 RepID=UPI00130D752F|nr:pitrilysin family protein [Gemmatirosa kalamazoonensis]